MQFRSVLLALCLAGCASHNLPFTDRPTSSPLEVTLMDAARKRPVPILLYGTLGGGRKPLAIISHGYGAHNGAYSFLANALVARGYLVASIEHLERPGDPPMVNIGNLAMLRRPVWQIGADSIGFVIMEMARRGLADTSGGAVVIGHSNGGDMTMLFATQHPEQVRVALSLDNRRMPLPRLRRPKICSLRSSDQVADAGVLPSPAEQAALGMSIVAAAVKHDDMWDGAATEQRATMLKAVDGCLNRQEGSGG
jgi:pimeloyl-ACP methyl ester carboxylesterase